MMMCCLFSFSCTGPLKPKSVKKTKNPVNNCCFFVVFTLIVTTRKLIEKKEKRQNPNLKTKMREITTFFVSDQNFKRI